MLSVALPTGRLLKPARALLSLGGWKLPVRLEERRRLILEAGKPPTRFIFVKPSDVPVYVEYGIADAGIAGADVLWESMADVLEPLDLEIGRCRLVVAGRNGQSLAIDGTGTLRVAMAVSTIIAGLVGVGPPDRQVPAPRGTKGTSISLARPTRD